MGERYRQIEGHCSTHEERLRANEELEARARRLEEALRSAVYWVENMPNEAMANDLLGSGWFQLARAALTRVNPPSHVGAPQGAKSPEGASNIIASRSGAPDLEPESTGSQHHEKPPSAEKS